MQDRFLHHTWSIRTISPFTIPLFSTLACPSTDSMEEQLTRYVRRFVILEDKTEESTATKTCTSEDGTYVTLTWINLIEAELNDVSEHTKDQQQYSKKPRLDSTIVTKSAAKTSQHLHIDIRVDDESVAQSVLCFSHQEGDTQSYASDTNSKSKTNANLNSFSFILMRGSISISEVVFQWLETLWGCAIGTRPFCPYPAEVASALATWTTASQFSSETSKPLEITLSVPDCLATSGLQKMSFTIPPIALTRLCRDMEQHRKLGTSSKKYKQSKDHNIVVPSDTTNMIKTSLDQHEHDTNSRLIVMGSSNEPSKTIEGPKLLPILTALQHFAEENFQMNIKSFILIRASSSVAVVGCDGRCKPLDATYLPHFLQEIQSMVQNRIKVHPVRDKKSPDADGLPEGGPEKSLAKMKY